MNTELIVSKNSIINKNVDLGNFTVIEQNTIIGHPELWTTESYVKLISKYKDLDEAFKNNFINKVYIGSNAIIRAGTIIYEGVSIGCNLQCGSNVIIRSGCSLGKNLYLKNNTEIMRDVKVGDCCRLAGVICDHTEIGNNVHSYGYIIHKQKNGISDEERKSSPKIGDNVFIGRGAVVMGKICIGDNVIIGANSFVDKDIPSNCKVIGTNNIVKI